MNHSEYVQQLKDELQKIEITKISLYAEEIELCKSINLDPIIDTLNSLYAPNSPRKPRDPVNMFRSILVMTISQIAGITEFVDKTRKEPAIAILCGWDVDDTPGVGTYYDFFNRLIDGKFRKECEHYTRPHKSTQSHSFLRLLHNEMQEQDKEKDKQTADKVVKELLSNSDTPRPEGINKLLQDILSLVSLKPSIENGTISNPDKLQVIGDGSYLFSFSDGNGKKTCDCQNDNNCSHPRSYSSPDAEWGFYPSKDLYYFGYHPYSLTTTNSKNKLLPLFHSMPTANSNDYVLSVKSVDEFLKSIKEMLY